MKQTRLFSIAGSFALLASLTLGCGAKEGAFPAGCPVDITEEAPVVATTNIGPVNASCAPDVSDDDCLRSLKDQACALGADAIWGVEDPKVTDGRKRVSGRAVKKK